jgi:hypothetical protein
MLCILVTDIQWIIIDSFQKGEFTIGHAGLWYFTVLTQHTGMCRRIVTSRKMRPWVELFYAVERTEGRANSRILQLVCEHAKQPLCTSSHSLPNIHRYMESLSNTTGQLARHGLELTPKMSTVLAKIWNLPISGKDNVWVQANSSCQRGWRRIRLEIAACQVNAHNYRPLVFAVCM